MKNYFKIGLLVGSLLALGLLTTGFFAFQRIIEKSENIADIDLTSFQYQTLDGEEVTLDDFGDKKILVNFWATWCAPCIAEFPLLNETLELVKDEYVFIMVSYESNEKIKAFVEKNPYQFIFLKSNNFMIEGISTVPQSFILNQDYEVIYHKPTIFDGNATTIVDSLHYWTGSKEVLSESY